MKGVILAGGKGTRLYPLTSTINKHLLPVGHYPMIYHPIQTLKESGINEILIVTGIDDMGQIARQLGSGKNFGVKFTYKVQEQAGGIAEALSLAEDFVKNEAFIAILGDNIFFENIRMFVNSFKESNSAAKVLIKEVESPERYGVAKIENGKVIKIIEKPVNPTSKYAVTGIYMYDATVFEKIKNITRSKRGELEITDVNNAYIEADGLTYDILQGNWIDAGTVEALNEANRLAMSVMLPGMGHGRGGS
ncbi:NTP transferase domain-containing protein [bacterium LRH843]|nr:NTP transferase domain-containing protein [bacterium LRH843]